MLRHRIGERAEGYIDLATRGSARFGEQHAARGAVRWIRNRGRVRDRRRAARRLWAAITGSLALVPFLGYVAVAALTLQLAMTGAATPALLSFGLGLLVLFCGDKIVRPVIARDGTRLPFVWVLMGCLGGFEVLGLVGLVIGPVVLALARELWEQRVRDLAPPDVTDRTVPG